MGLGDGVCGDDDWGDICGCVGVCLSCIDDYDYCKD